VSAESLLDNNPLTSENLNKGYDIIKNKLTEEAPLRDGQGLDTLIWKNT
jgi:hypothetical protein